MGRRIVVMKLICSLRHCECDFRLTNNSATWTKGSQEGDGNDGEPLLGNTGAIKFSYQTKDSTQVSSLRYWLRTACMTACDVWIRGAQIFPNTFATVSRFLASERWHESSSFLRDPPYRILSLGRRGWRPNFVHHWYRQTIAARTLHQVNFGI